MVIPESGQGQNISMCEMQECEVFQSRESEYLIVSGALEMMCRSGRTVSGRGGCKAT